MPWTEETGRCEEVAIWDDGRRFGLCFDYEVLAVEAVKELPAYLRKWDPDLKVWWIFDQQRAYELARIAAAYTLCEVEHYLSAPDWLEARAEWIASRGWERRRSQRGSRSASSPNGSAWAVLHLAEDAPPQVVKAAYRALAQMHHPDAGGDEERMKAVNNAYEELTE